MTDKVTLTFYHNPKSEEDRDTIIEVLISYLGDLKERGYDISESVVGSHHYEEEADE